MIDNSLYIVPSIFNHCVVSALSRSSNTFCISLSSGLFRMLHCSAIVALLHVCTVGRDCTKWPFLSRVRALLHAARCCRVRGVSFGTPIPSLYFTFMRYIPLSLIYNTHKYLSGLKTFSLFSISYCLSTKFSNFGEIFFLS